jgi:hypothetical protein
MGAELIFFDLDQNEVWSPSATDRAKGVFPT